MDPPRPTLQWDEVVEYAFLSDFDLLRDARQEIQHRPWATPAGRLAMDTHFKLLHAHEEIDRLNVEIRRFATHLRDEDYGLRSHEKALHPTNPALAHQIRTYRMLRGRFKAHHERCLSGIAKMLDFTGTIVPGECLEGPSVPIPALTASHGLRKDDDPPANAEAEDERVQLEQEVEEEEEDMEFSRDVLDVLNASLDAMHLRA